MTEHQWRIDSIETPAVTNKSLKYWKTHLFGTTDKPQNLEINPDIVGLQGQDLAKKPNATPVTHVRGVKDWIHPSCKTNLTRNCGWFLISLTGIG